MTIRSARRGLARLLRTAGHGRSVSYASAQPSFSILSDSETCECLVLDARMPGLSGEELQAELKERGVHLPIIVVTADDDPETRKKAQRLGAAGFFRKPVDGAALLDAIAWALRPANLTAVTGEERHLTGQTHDQPRRRGLDKNKGAREGNLRTLISNDLRTLSRWSE